jgi:hypothetical protein
MKTEGYKVLMHKFKGTTEYDGKRIGYTYELTFNKSLEHTGKHRGIEKGLDDYTDNEIRNEVKDNFLALCKSFKYWIWNLLKITK